MNWLIDEARAPAVADVERALQLPLGTRAVRGARTSLAVRLNDVVVHDTKKWFGGANIRLDAMVVHGPGDDGSAAAEGLYRPGTWRFSNVRDGERLSIDAPGLLIFYGRPAHFLDISILVSRDRKDSEELGALVAKHLGSDEWKSAAASLLGLAVAAPQAAAVFTAMASAAAIANFAGEILRKATSDTIALYRTSWLQHRDRFGLGRHPEAGVFTKQALSFWYEIVPDRRERPP
ncbi:MAG TPA: hypothetical protein VMX54_05170 [Vicinamibacteria bacterium]|nr:hypothetical protein [Vicinamibacteria bacterium]